MRCTKIFLATCSLLLTTFSFAQSTQQINWLTINDIDKLWALNAKQPKNVLMFIYFSECGLCGEKMNIGQDKGIVTLGEDGKPVNTVHKVGCSFCASMDEQVWQNPEIAAYANEHFYMVRIDASYEDTIRMGDKDYYAEALPNPSGKKRMITRLHGIAKYFTQKEDVNFPTMVIYDDELKGVGTIVGYKYKFEVDEILKFVVQDKHKSLTLDAFLKQKNVDRKRKFAVENYTGEKRMFYGNANQLFREAYQLDKTDPQTLMWLSILMYQGECEFEQDQAKAQEIAKQALPLLMPKLREWKEKEVFHEEAWFLWGMAHVFGLAMDADIPKGIGILREVIRKGTGYIPAVLVYGEYLHAKEDYYTAFAAFDLAAVAGVKESMLTLAKYHENGWGTEKNLEKAKAWYKKACTKGMKEACERLEKGFWRE